MPAAAADVFLGQLLLKDLDLLLERVSPIHEKPYDISFPSSPRRIQETYHVIDGIRREDGLQHLMILSRAPVRGHWSIRARSG